MSDANSRLVLPLPNFDRIYNIKCLLFHYEIGGKLGGLVQVGWQGDRDGGHK